MTVMEGDNTMAGVCAFCSPLRWKQVNHIYLNEAYSRASSFTASLSNTAEMCVGTGDQPGGGGQQLLRAALEDKDTEPGCLWEQPTVHSAPCFYFPHPLL